MVRGKNYIKTEFKSKDIYKHYKSTIAKDKPIRPYGEYIKITQDLNQGLMNIILDGDNIKLPARLGIMRIKKTKMNLKYPKSMKVDWVLTKKYKKFIYHLNDHRNHHKYKFYWCKQGIIKNISWYCFIPTRTNKRRLAHILKNNKEIDYLT